MILLKGDQSFDEQPAPIQLLHGHQVLRGPQHDVGQFSQRLCALRIAPEGFDQFESVTPFGKLTHLFGFLGGFLVLLGGLGVLAIPEQSIGQGFDQCGIDFVGHVLGIVQQGFQNGDRLGGLVTKHLHVGQVVVKIQGPHLASQGIKKFDTAFAPSLPLDPISRFQIPELDQVHGLPNVLQIIVFLGQVKDFKTQLEDLLILSKIDGRITAKVQKPGRLDLVPSNTRQALISNLEQALKLPFTQRQLAHHPQPFAAQLSFAAQPPQDHLTSSVLANFDQRATQKLGQIGGQTDRQGIQELNQCLKLGPFKQFRGQRLQQFQHQVFTVREQVVLDGFLRPSVSFGLLARRQVQHRMAQRVATQFGLERRDQDFGGFVRVPSERSDWQSGTSHLRQPTTGQVAAELRGARLVPGFADRSGGQV